MDDLFLFIDCACAFSGIAGACMYIHNTSYMYTYVGNDDVGASTARSERAKRACSLYVIVSLAYVQSKFPPAVHDTQLWYTVGGASMKLCMYING